MRSFVSLSLTIAERTMVLGATWFLACKSFLKIKWYADVQLVRKSTRNRIILTVFSQLYDWTIRAKNDALDSFCLSVGEKRRRGGWITRERSLLRGRLPKNHDDQFCWSKIYSNFGTSLIIGPGNNESECGGGLENENGRKGILCKERLGKNRRSAQIFSVSPRIRIFLLLTADLGWLMYTVQ